MDPITIALGLAQLAPVLMRLFGVGENNAVLAEKVIEIAKDVTGAPTGEQALNILQSDPSLVLTFQQFVLANNKELELAYLSDRQDARKRDAEFIRAGKTNTRANAMLILTFLGIIGCAVTMVALNVDANTAVGGILIMLIGKFVSMWGTAFDFEFGSSRGSKEKDEQNLVVAIKEARKEHRE